MTTEAYKIIYACFLKIFGEF